ncbi:DNA polymerase-3 subunit gamma/tau [Modicisalibacter ilicicola DSM 19980]|uniref:DNA polymerase III subunit gamma/tau n=1 Tax=Modicisalibacter ilicicola DSM 19980 TaxID=1121942 RepID=A0A1M4YJB7_9GAMM|nr:DNA polymerase III subunit gamma/tau [Halomonas ilicicola]SHF05738.1 DNA polymerase-3 subunit gamma/tau [Halomonas ilicicola DSM 19980]
MSYQVLARKWRPRTFHELVGQEHVQRALVNALDQGRLHHAYLFTGTRGVGKTTLARILAKCLNCTAAGRGDEGVTSRPCGECDSCRAIDEGRFVDLIEVDAASRTKVEDTRELLDNVQYAPAQGRYKVYLIDEVHMLSTHSFNALLKTLEEPPSHVKFLLATTDPQKLPVTVLSRCLQFTLKNMPPERIVEHLSRVMTAEQVAYEDDALWLLGKAADGSMRDAMSLTDQAIAFGQGVIRRADVAAMLGTLDHRLLLTLVEALAEADAARVLSEVASLAEQGPDFAGVLDDLTGVFHRLAIAQMVPDALDNGHGDRDALLALAARFTAEDVQLYYQIGLQGRADMESAPDARTALEMTLLRMLAFRPQGVPRPPRTPLPLRGEANTAAANGASNIDTPADAPPEVSEPRGPASDAVTVDEPPPWEMPSEPPSAPAAAASGEAMPSEPTESESTESESTEPESTEPESTEPEPAECEPRVEAEGQDDSRVLDHAGWLALFRRLTLSGLTRSLAAHCVVEDDDGRCLRLRLDPSQAAMNAEVHVERIERALAEAGIERRVSVEPGAIPDGVETPKACSDREAAERHAEAVEALRGDPHIQQLEQAFDARLLEQTVSPQTQTE